MTLEQETVRKQAERERDEAQQESDEALRSEAAAIDRANAAEAQLAKVPALVEALRRFTDATPSAAPCARPCDHGICRAILALAAYEQEQKQ